MTGATPNHDACQSMPADSGLRCPKCEYNLTGVTENRCPECGGVFDRAKLEAELSVGPLPIPVLDDASNSWAHRIVQMCLRTWFVPWRVGVSFPDRYRASSVAVFRRHILAVALAIMAVVPMAQPELTGWWLAGSCGGLVAILGFEMVLTLFLIIALVPLRPVPPVTLLPGVEISYHGLVTTFRSYSIIAAVAAALCFCAEATQFSPSSPRGYLVLLVCLWWWAGLASAIIVQPVRLCGKVICCLLIPPIAIGCGVLGGVVAFIIGMILYDF